MALELFHDKDITSCNLSKNKKFVISTSWDKAVKFWNIENIKTAPVVFYNDDVVENSIQSPNGNFLLSFGRSNNGVFFTI
ncbi:MAG: hypothetical protein IPP71_16005 [Bacteroidetes bacterium]|nr:hypothetical protein [Bacteroidota bacterium]